MRIPAQLTLLIAEHNGLVDAEVLARYSAMLYRAEQAEARLMGGVTADSLVQAADAYRHYSSHDTGGFVATKKGPDVFGFHGAKAVKRIAALNVGLLSGLPLETLCHSCLYGMPMAQLMKEATENNTRADVESAVDSLKSLDDDLRANPEMTYSELSRKYAEAGLAVDTRGFVERWAKRRSFDSPDRAYVPIGESARNKAVDLWQSEQALAVVEERAPRKSNAWTALCNVADRTKGSGDAAVCVVNGVPVRKMTFYQWLHRAEA